MGETVAGSQAETKKKQKDEDGKKEHRSSDSYKASLFIFSDPWV